MKSIVISSNSSGGGKTTISVGIMKALMKKGFDVQGYKVGPDYIDPAFHSKITGKPSRNLDIYLMEEEGIKASYSRGKGELGVVEGVMGLYDGKGIDSKYSTAHVAKTLELPVVLVLSPKAQSATLCAEINGLMNFEEIQIGGIILNNISESYYNLLKAAIEYNCNVKVLGYIPKDERLKIGSRHLGLIQSSEIEDLEEKIDICSEHILKNVDIDELLKIFKETPVYEDNFHLQNEDLKIAVAYDKAFSFYYRENIELLEELGEVIYFSPLNDKKLPKDIDFLYIGGGYPEVFIEELSKNKSMLKSIKEELDKGLKCYAECGGLMYLTEAIENNEGLKGDTVGYFKGTSKMTKRLQNFGYAQLEVCKENEILPKGLTINCHEFHKSIVELDEKTIFKINKTMYNGETKNWHCGYIKGNTIAAYAHVNFLGNTEFLKALLKK
ncbi:cobyrinate a,c-diamide synthase [Clostridium cochlearium]|jgi:cobyrinic acid a,c-diamide synthase|uniref:cobyrinate a,c-diamide synthase n=1 Tax=Clostridium cochlearium TaxID=1494 RepID=UPI000BBC73A2|nr:cobyrinate a,c-diamide synthase [Clostridium cochlearium]MBU5269144.1 cobyrinate a,c-diamide synthase [Clostridium cochlearium]MCG4571138.1 cobyrinate a,c-diamide synthase [Clostridium cochlearium]MCR1971435.1 cobyrinate a,c-diamide synthase [Clostridium cochlearium]MDU1442341.1 cobyrinate a,c-diamide synthase [Clostridium cochlearium]NMA58758.1 cobyrinate a,c-diamide synthase [Clostridium cochlearium]